MVIIICRPNRVILSVDAARLVTGISTVWYHFIHLFIHSINVTQDSKLSLFTNTSLGEVIQL
jgi:hypothetical protein